MENSKGDLSYIFKAFTDYRDYYKILGINLRPTTDENVKMAYCNQLEQMKNFLKNYENDKKYNELREIIETTLLDAYTALKSENSRKHYEELLNYINNKRLNQRCDYDKGEER